MLFAYRSYLYQKYLSLIELFDNHLELWDWLLSFLFYYFLSVKLEQVVLANTGFVYSQFSTDQALAYRDLILSKANFFLLPNQLFNQVFSLPEEQLEDFLFSVFAEIEKTSELAGWREHFSGLLTSLDLTADLISKSKRIKRLKACLALVKETVKSPVGSYDVNKTFADVFSVLLRFFPPQKRRLIGQFITPKKVTSLLAGLVYDNQKENVMIFDPVCGVGDLLLSVWLQYRNKKAIIYGQDNSSKACRIARMNCLINGLTRWEFHIRQENVVTNNNDTDFYDVIVADSLVHEENLNLDLATKWFWIERGLDIADFGNRLDAFVVLDAVQKLTVNGIAAILVYPGLLHSQGSFLRLRQFLLSENLVDAVISLSSNVVFHTELNPQILILRKKRLFKEVLFINASREYFPSKEFKEDNRPILDGLTTEGVNKIIRFYQDRKELANFSKLVPLAQIEKNNYLLSVANYVSHPQLDKF